MSWAIVIPGNGRADSGGTYRLSERCDRCLEVAAELAELRMPRAVVFTGWSPNGGPSEAEQMLERWPGRRDVELVVESSARITAENMARSLPLLIERGIEEATLVCGALHLPRVRYFFGSVYPRYGIRCHYRAVRDTPTPRALAWEAAAFPLMRRQRRAALTELVREDLGLSDAVANARGRFDAADAMLVVANVLWSLNYATTKYAFGWWQPLAFSFSRFAVAGLLFSVFVLRREGSLRVRRADVPLVLGAAAVGILGNQLTFSYAVDNTTAGNVALILGAAPAFAALFAMVAGHEHVRAKHWLALGVSVTGLALVVQGGAGVAGAGYLGDLLAVGAALTWAAYSVMLRPLFGRYSAARISALMIVIGGTMLFPFSLPQLLSQDWSLPPLAVSAWAYSAIFPLLVTNLLYFRALRRIGAARATLYMYLQPFLGALFAAWLLGEQITALQVAGGAVIVLGVSLGQLMPGATVRE